jgi:hypothetical protein
MSGRRKSTSAAAYVGDVLPPPPAIPEPQKTEAELAKEAFEKAEIARLIREIREEQREDSLSRAVVLAQMAHRRQGPLVDFFEELGRRYAKLADEGPQRAGPGLRVINGSAMGEPT